MPAGADERPAGREDARARQLAGGDRATKREVGAVRLGYEAYGRYAALDGTARVTGHPKREIDRRLTTRLARWVAQMRVHVDQPRQKICAVEVNDLRLASVACSVEDVLDGADRRDYPVPRQDAGVAERRAALGVDDGAVDEDDAHATPRHPRGVDRARSPASPKAGATAGAAGPSATTEALQRVRRSGGST